MQEAQKLHAEVVWRAGRLAGELAEARRDVEQLSAQARFNGATRTISDVDADMEALDNQRTALEREKETALRRQERLRFHSLHVPPPSRDVLQASALSVLLGNVSSCSNDRKPNPCGGEL